MTTTRNGDRQVISNRQLALSWREDEIISASQRIPRIRWNGKSVKGFLFPPEQPIAYVKFGRPSKQRMAKTRNHEYAFIALKSMPPHQTRGILIPEIYRTFESESRFWTIMEYIPAIALTQLLEAQDWESRKETVINSIAEATRLLMSIPAPPGQRPGPVGGGFIRHPLFKDDESYCEYASVDELESHLNRVSTIRDKIAPTVHLEQNMCFYFSDFYPGNFLFTDAGDICIIHFDQAGFLPPSFMSYALARSHWGPGNWIRDILRLPEHNLEAMKNIFYWFAIAVPWLGLSGPDPKRWEKGFAWDSLFPDT